MVNYWKIPVMIITGVFAGFLNTVSGGGSLIALPVLIFLGLSPAVANGTNRVAVFMQNASAIAGFRRKGVSDFLYSALHTVPALIGAWRGAKWAISMDDAWFNRILAGIMILVLFTTLFNPTKKLKGGIEHLSIPRRIIGVVAFYFIGIYGGFIQAGVGFIIISALTTINGFDLVRSNAIKVFVIFFYTIIALGVFIMENKVDWYLGLSLAVGNASGAWIGSQWAADKGEKVIKIILVVTMVAFATRLIWRTL